MHVLDCMLAMITFSVKMKDFPDLAKRDGEEIKNTYLSVKSPKSLGNISAEILKDIGNC